MAAWRAEDHRLEDYRPTPEEFARLLAEHNIDLNGDD